MPKNASRTIGIVACGAIARELVQLKEHNRCRQWHIYCIPAELHNRPAEITPAVRRKLELISGRHDQLFVAYADCGTAGALDSLLKERNVARLPGAHCYDIFAGEKVLRGMLAKEPGTFFLTDFLVRHFERLVFEGLCLDRLPHLRDHFFGNYSRVIYLAQTRCNLLEERARRCAERLNLSFDYRFTGLAVLGKSMAEHKLIAW